MPQYSPWSATVLFLLFILIRMLALWAFPRSARAGLAPLALPITSRRQQSPYPPHFHSSLPASPHWVCSAGAESGKRRQPPDQTANRDFRETAVRRSLCLPPLAL